MSSTPTATAPDPRRWKALAVLGLIQFMLVLDVTVVNVALPQVQRDLGFTPAGLAWVVDGYVLMAGGLLLLGGALADYLGRRRMFLAGVALFALASIACGAAVAPSMLVGARFVQGAGQALAAPASLGLIALLFPDPRERMKAIGMWGGIAGLGGVTGSVIGGALVDFASWRWIFLINVPIAAVALALVPRLVAESRMVRSARRPLLAGALAGTVGLVGVVDGLLAAASHPWGSVQVLVPLFAGLALVAAMLVIESRSSSPLIPLSVFRNRTRAVTNGVSLLFSAAFFSYFFLMTLYQQQIAGWSPMRSGMSFVPFGVTIGLGIGVGTALMPRLGVKPLLAAGFAGSAVGLWLTSGLHVGSSYAGSILPGMLVLALGAGLSFPAIGNAALHEVTGQDSGLASGMQNAMQSVGGALGLAVLVTLAARHATDAVTAGTSRAEAATAGFSLAWRLGALLLVVGAALVVVLLERVKAASPVPEADGVVPAAVVPEGA